MVNPLGYSNHPIGGRRTPEVEGAVTERAIYHDTGFEGNNIKRVYHLHGL